MELSDSACNGQKLLLVSSYPLHSRSSQQAMFTAPRSAAPSDTFGTWQAAVGYMSTMDSDCLNRSCMTTFQRPQLLHVDSQNASGLSSGSWVSWCMYIYSIIHQLLLFPRGSQVTFSIAEVGLLWLSRHSVTLPPAFLATPSQKNSPCFLWFSGETSVSQVLNSMCTSQTGLLHFLKSLYPLWSENRFSEIYVYFMM